MLEFIFSGQCKNISFNSGVSSFFKKAGLDNLFFFISPLFSPSPHTKNRRPCATRHRHSLPSVLAHTGRHRGEHAPPHCGEPDQDHGCVSGRISGLLNTKP